MREVKQNRLSGFKGKLVGSSEKFSHSSIDKLLDFLQNPADSDLVNKSLNRIIEGE